MASAVHRVMAAAAVCVCAGCASVVDGTTQIISVSTTPEVGADCVCSNDLGQWPVSTPGNVLIKKSQSVLVIRCNKQGYREGKFFASGRMTTAGMVGMAMPYVGIVSAAVDATSGASLTYPSSYVIVMKPAAAVPASPKADNNQAPTGDCKPDTDCKKTINGSEP